MIDTIFVIGKAGCGKSNMIWFLSSLLTEDGYSLQYYSDRIGLEEATMRDVAHVKPDENGVKVGKHSKLLADGPPGHKKVHVLDGRFLNRVHENHIQLIGHAKDHAVNIVEYALGPDIDFGPDKEALLQSANYLVSVLQKYQVKEKVFIIDIEAPLSVRELRESKRPDAMAVETFRAYFNDGGEMTVRDKKFLGSQYHQFLNIDEDHEWYYTEVRYIYEQMLQPRLMKPGLQKHRRMRRAL